MLLGLFIFEMLMNSETDAFLIGILFVGILMASVFRLDALAASSKRPRKRRRAPCGVDPDGQDIFCDPDGTPWQDERSDR
jgi:hypothetical protein